MPAKAPPLTDLEGRVLAQLVQTSGMTTYDIMKALSGSPLTGLPASAGAIYPAVRRLRERGLISARAGHTGRRQHEVLKITKKGQTTVRSWVAQVNASDLLPHDPLQAKLLLFHLLTPAEQERWLAEFKKGLAAIASTVKSIEAATADEAPAAVASTLAAVRRRRALIDRLTSPANPRVPAADLDPA